MKVATWNVNSIRVRLEMVLDWLAEARPDVICLQETKVADAEFPAAAFEDLGYNLAISGQKAFNGVAIVSRYALGEVLAGFPDYEAEGQKRLIAASIGPVRLVNVYIPNGSAPESAKFVYKLQFIEQLRGYLERWHRPDELLLLVGDFNVAPEGRDVYDPVAMQEQIGFHPKERAALASLKSWGLVDVFRRHHGEAGLYSWWDYRAGAFRRNLGLRIDHIWATAPLAGRSTASGMDKRLRALARPSDHIPVWAVFDCEPAEGRAIEGT